VNLHTYLLSSLSSIKHHIPSYASLDFLQFLKDLLNSYSKFDAKTHVLQVLRNVSSMLEDAWLLVSNEIVAREMLETLYISNTHFFIR